MINQVVDSRKSSKTTMTYRIVLIFCTAFLIYGCNQNQSKDFVKLDASLQESLKKITLIVPDEEDKDGNPLEITLGETHSGKAEYSISGDETSELEYTLLSKHAVEGNKYVFTIVSYSLGGTGTFYYLTAVDKSTLKSVHEVLLGDRVSINSLKLNMPNTDSVTINYMDRETGTAFTEDPDENVTKHFSMLQNKFSQFWIEKLE